ANPGFTRNQTSALSAAAIWNRGRHNLSFGGDLRRQQFNLLSQQDPRGSFTDDWRINPGLTLNAGIRWEYGSPITELYGRLVNLDLTPGFTAQTPVVASKPSGPLTKQTYPDSLVRPDKQGFQP